MNMQALGLVLIGIGCIGNSIALLRCLVTIQTLQKQVAKLDDYYSAQFKFDALMRNPGDKK